MYLTPEVKKDIFKEFGKSEVDTGSIEGQIALFTFRIKHLTEHVKENHKDLGTKRSLVRLVGKRKKLLSYVKSKNLDEYRNLIKKLKIRG